MSNNQNNDLPSLTPDRDQVEAFNHNRVTANTKSSHHSSVKNQKSAKPQATSKSSPVTVFLILVIIIAGGYGSWSFYQQDLAHQAKITAAEKRIQSLEEQLSVTGEEMGESAVAMKVRLEKLTKRTDELWTQMDKLWSSAWRRNQTDIKAVDSKVKSLSNKLTKQIKEFGSSVKTLAALQQKQSEADFSIGVISEQVQKFENLTSDLESIKNSLSTIQSNSLSRDKQQIGLASNISQMTETQNRILSQIAELEKRLSGAGVP